MTTSEVHSVFKIIRQMERNQFNSCVASLLLLFLALTAESTGEGQPPFARSSAYEPFEAPFQFMLPRVYELHARKYSVKDDHGQRARRCGQCEWAGAGLVVSYDTTVPMDLNMDGVWHEAVEVDWLPSSPQSKFAPAMVARRIAGLSETAAVDDDAATRNMLKSVAARIAEGAMNRWVLTRVFSNDDVDNDKYAHITSALVASSSPSSHFEPSSRPLVEEIMLMGRSHAAAYFFLRVNITATLGLASGSVEICHKMNLSQESCSDVAAFADHAGQLVHRAHARDDTRNTGSPTRWHAIWRRRGREEEEEEENIGGSSSSSTTRMRTLESCEVAASVINGASQPKFTVLGPGNWSFLPPSQKQGRLRGEGGQDEEEESDGGDCTRGLPMEVAMIAFQRTQHAVAMDESGVELNSIKVLSSSSSSGGVGDQNEQPSHPFARAAVLALDVGAAGRNSPDHRLSAEEFALPGMSGEGNRILMNALVRAMHEAATTASPAMARLLDDDDGGGGGTVKYLEVGSYKGSTMAAAICGNGAAIQRADSVEDFSEFDGAAARDLLRKNVRKCESSAVEESSRRKSRKQRMFVEGGSGSPPPPPPPPFAGVTFHESRFQNPALLKGGLADSGFNLYLYDGPHAEQDHYDALALLLPALADEFVLVVDDWAWLSVKGGTRRAIAELGLEVLWGAEAAGPDWHNGCFVGVFRKKDFA